MVEVYIGLGSNVDPETHLKRALTALASRFGSLVCSDVYQSPPHGFDGDDFLNMVVRLDSEAPAEAIDSVLSVVEHAGGRPAVKRSGSRTLDLDLLLYGRRVDAALRLPREDILRYAFVLAPLAGLAPGLRHPLTGATMAAAWQDMFPEQPPLDRLGAAEAVLKATSRRSGRRRQR